MTRLALLFWIKIAVTALCVVLPLLFFDTLRVQAMTGILIVDPLAKIYAVQVTAVLVGYVAALKALSDGRFPRDIVILGIVSNASAACAIVTWVPAPIKSPGALVFGGFAVLLVAALWRPNSAMRSLP
ncbi:hypothetical protein ACS3SW_14685 [Roseobacteraceae bacterium S113]